MNEQQILKQIQDWRDSYIDINEKNNNLLNQNKECSHAIELITTEVCDYKYFWDLAVGKRGQVQINLDTDHMHKQANSNSSGWRPVRGGDNMSHGERMALLDRIYESGHETIVQRGENPICLTFGRMEWNIKIAENKNDTPFDNSRMRAQKIEAANRYGRVFERDNVVYMRLSTPLVFVPIVFSHIGNLYSLKTIPADSNLVTINPALIIRFGREEGYPFPLPSCGQLIDNALQFDIDSYFYSLEREFNTSIDPNEFHFDSNYVCIDTYDYDKICMYRDLLGHENDLASNAVIRGFYGAQMPLSAQQRAALSAIDAMSPPIPMIEDSEVPGTQANHVSKRSAAVANTLAPLTSYQILDSDSSQCEAVERFKNGESFVLQGPPGTGKTQTIINLIAEAFIAGKKVLFVSSKMSALKTVIKKLQLMPNANIAKHCLLILGESEDYKSNVNDTYDKLKAAYNAYVQSLNQADYRDNIQRLEAARDGLLAYNAEFYDAKNSLNMSIYDIIGRILMLGYKNEYIAMDFAPSFLRELTRTQLAEHAKRIGKVEDVLYKLIKRSGSIEQDVWYGYQRYVFEGRDREFIGGFCDKVEHRLQTIQPAFVPPADQTDRKASAVSIILKDLAQRPLRTIAILCDRTLTGDIRALSNKRDLSEEKKLVAAEVEKAKHYRAAVMRIKQRLGDKIPEIDIDHIRNVLEANAHYNDLHITQIKQEIASVSALLGANTDGFTHIDAMELAELESFLAVIDQYIALEEQLKADKEEILNVFKPEIFDYDYSKLQEKFIKSWRDNLAKGKDPMGFNGQIKGLLQLCVSYDTQLGIKDVAEWIVKLELRKSNLALLEQLKQKIAEVGLSDYTRGVLLYFKDILNRYFVAKEDYRKNNLFSTESFNFLPYLQNINYALQQIMNAGRAIGINADLTVAELKAIADDLAVVIAENRRLDDSLKLKAIMPTMYHGCATDWQGVYNLLDIVSVINFVVSEQYRFNTQDASEVYDTIIRLFQDEVRDAILQCIEKYSSFYANEEWFDPAYIIYHDVNAMTYDKFVEWVAQVRDLDHIDEYIRYRTEVKGLEGSPEGVFFDEWSKKGRRSFPYDLMKNHYEISVLFAYYDMLMANTKAVSRLCGKGDLKQLQQQFIDADVKAMQYNREIVDLALSGRVEQNTSKHAYLNAPRSSRNYSVRKLLKDRHDSILELAPCLMMSVYSVSKLLPFEQYKFDVVIFDEASQIPMEDSLPAIMRTTSQIVIAGDPQQMPAISYFKAKVAAENPDSDEATDCMSLIDFAMDKKDSVMRTYHLNMHYRSNHESLINYSNQRFYGGKLVSFPSPRSRNADFGLYNYNMVDIKGEVTGGGGENKSEVDMMMDLLREHFTKYPLPSTEQEIEQYNDKHSIGVIVFGTKQEALLRRTMAHDSLLRKVVEFADTRVFSITTVDNIQGDEMTNMILSLTYGRDGKGAVSLGWGHMNQDVAPKKFNVAVTRARDNLKFVHSVAANDIEGSPKLAYVADYLRQFNTGTEKQFISDNSRNTDFIRAVGALCEEVVGADRVVYNFGASARTYRVPISILSQDKTEVVLGIMCEKNRLDDGFSVREYTRTCPGILRARGWTSLYETNAIQWVRNYPQEHDNLISAVNAVADK